MAGAPTPAIAALNRASIAYTLRPYEHDPRTTAFGDETLEDGDNLIGVDRPVDIDRQALTSELVDHVEHLDRAPVGESVELEVECPQHVRTDRAHRTDVRAHAGETLLALLGRDAQPLVAPQTPDTLVVHLVAIAAGLLRSASPSPPRAGRREVAEELAQLRLLVGDQRRLETLRRAVEPDDLAGPSFRDPEPFAQHANGCALAVRGQKFPSATSRSMSMSSAWFATNFFKRAFSDSSSFNRLASEAFIPPY